MKNKFKIHFILEGNEEELLFDIIKNSMPGSNLEISYKNSNGGGKIAPYYNEAIIDNKYDLVFCVYDVDFILKIKMVCITEYVKV